MESPQTDTIPGLIDRLVEHKTLGSAPRQELKWLAEHGTLRRLDTGEVLSSKDKPVAGFYVLLSGWLAIFIDRGSGPSKGMEWRAGDVTGVLPYSRLVSPPGNVMAMEPVEILALPRERIPELTHECYEITSILVHSMLDRTRQFTASDLQNEKMISLGKLSAGLAHELNNPAAAIERSAAQLEGRLQDSEDAARVLGTARLSDEQVGAVDAIRATFLIRQTHGVRSPLQQTDREGAFADWLADHGLDEDAAELLADSEVGFEDLDRLADVLTGPTLNGALRFAASGGAIRSLAAEIQESAKRISDLVKAIKGFTHMDQATVAQPVDLGPSLGNTVAVLKAKAREKKLAVVVEIELGVPMVRGFAGELNQVWGNLIDNALDAAPVGGRVEVTAIREGGNVAVRVVDNGTGIPEAIRARIFDPFFTTKPMGQGTGLGLDIVRRLVRHNDGTIEVESRPGRTVFSVTLPVADSGGAAR